MTLCAKCGETEVWVDGTHCIDCWPGYDNCADPRCHHYRCEHGVRGGTKMEVVYSKDGNPSVGSVADWGEGCWNADCPCGGFQEK